MSNTLRDELAAHERDGLSTITLGLGAILGLLARLDAAEERQRALEEVVSAARVVADEFHGPPRMRFRVSHGDRESIPTAELDALRRALARLPAAGEGA